MTTLTQPEPWLRGPVDGFEPLLMPVVHALIQVREDIENLVARVLAEHTWERPGGAASIGFHVRHIGGALDRLFTYARGEALSDTQKAAMRAEGDLVDPAPSLADVAGGARGAAPASSEDGTRRFFRASHTPSLPCARSRPTRRHRAPGVAEDTGQ